MTNCGLASVWLKAEPQIQTPLMGPRKLEVHNEDSEEPVASHLRAAGPVAYASHLCRPVTVL